MTDMMAQIDACCPDGDNHVLIDPKPMRELLRSMAQKQWDDKQATDGAFTSMSMTFNNALAGKQDAFVKGAAIPAITTTPSNANINVVGIQVPTAASYTALFGLCLEMKATINLLSAQIKTSGLIN